MENYSRTTWKSERIDRKVQYSHARLLRATSRYNSFVPSIIAVLAITPMITQSIA